MTEFESTYKLECAQSPRTLAQNLKTVLKTTNEQMGIKQNRVSEFHFQFE